MRLALVRWPGCARICAVSFQTQCSLQCGPILVCVSCKLHRWITLQSRNIHALQVGCRTALRKAEYLWEMWRQTSLNNYFWKIFNKGVKITLQLVMKMRRESDPSPGHLTCDSHLSCLLHIHIYFNWSFLLDEYAHFWAKIGQSNAYITGENRTCTMCLLRVKKEGE